MGLDGQATEYPQQGIQYPCEGIAVGDGVGFLRLASVVLCDGHYGVVADEGEGELAGDLDPAVDVRGPETNLVYVQAVL